VLTRICIQAINYPGFIEDIDSLLRMIRKVTKLPISLDAPPLDKDSMERLKQAGLDRIGIPLDAATPDLFDVVKGRIVKSPYRWHKHIEALKTAVEIFGVNKVMSNLIIGLGETEKEAIRHIQTLMDMEIQTALFAFTPIPGTVLADRPQPPLKVYRRIQLARHLITAGLTRYDDMEFEDDKLRGFTNNPELISSDLLSGEAFQTSGCPGCNRPYYNERPSGPFYNYPRKLSQEEIEREIRSLELKGIY
jgi:biotin synthase